MMTASTAMPESRPVPATAGIGLRTAHHREFLARRQAVAWVEVHSENFFADGGHQTQVLDAVRQDHAVSLHGVGLSLGSADEPDEEHLRRLERLVRRVDPVLVSEHLAWGSVDGVFLNDLLPLPRTAEALIHTAARISRIQDRLGREILIENVSSYLEFPDNEMPEWEFLVGVARRAGCRILLDVNNVHVAASNHGFDARKYIAAIPPPLVGEIHLAGHRIVEDDAPGSMLLIDTHDAPVATAVWDLYRFTIGHLGPRPTLIEWDSALPALDELIGEAHRADRIAGGCHAAVA